MGKKKNRGQNKKTSEPKHVESAIENRQPEVQNIEDHVSEEFYDACSIVSPPEPAQPEEYEAVNLPVSQPEQRIDVEQNFNEMIESEKTEIEPNVLDETLTDDQLEEARQQTKSDAQQSTIIDDSESFVDQGLSDNDDHDLVEQEDLTLLEQEGQGTPNEQGQEDQNSQDFEGQKAPNGQQDLVLADYENRSIDREDQDSFDGKGSDLFENRDQDSPDNEEIVASTGPFEDNSENPAEDIEPDTTFTEEKNDYDDNDEFDDFVQASHEDNAQLDKVEASVQELIDIITASLGSLAVDLITMEPMPLLSLDQVRHEYEYSIDLFFTTFSNHLIRAYVSSVNAKYSHIPMKFEFAHSEFRRKLLLNMDLK